MSPVYYRAMLRRTRLSGYFMPPYIVCPSICNV